MSFFSKLFQGYSSNKDILKEQLQNGAFLVDVREPFEFLDGSALNAVNVPLGTIPNQITKFKNKEHIIVFCRSGNRSKQAKIMLEQNGFTNVTNGGTWHNIVLLQA